MFTKFTVQKMKFSIKDFFSKCDQILNEKLHFFCSNSAIKKNTLCLQANIDFIRKMQIFNRH